MTRDEAIKAYVEKAFLRKIDTTESYREAAVSAGYAIDAFVALGMLKLDEPKCASERAVDAMFSVAAYSGMLTPRHAMEAISAAGLKIIEK